MMPAVRSIAAVALLFLLGVAALDVEVDLLGAQPSFTDAQDAGIDSDTAIDPAAALPGHRGDGRPEFLTETDEYMDWEYMEDDTEDEYMVKKEKRFPASKNTGKDKDKDKDTEINGKATGKRAAQMSEDKAARAAMHQTARRAKAMDGRRLGHGGHIDLLIPLRTEDCCFPTYGCAHNNFFCLF